MKEPVAFAAHIQGIGLGLMLGFLLGAYHVEWVIYPVGALSLVLMTVSYVIDKRANR